MRIAREKYYVRTIGIVSVIWKFSSTTEKFYYFYSVTIELVDMTDFRLSVFERYE